MGRAKVVGLGVVLVILASGFSVAQETPSYIEELKALAELRDQGVITEEEFEQRKRALLDLDEDSGQPDPADSPMNMLTLDGVIVVGKNPGDLRGRWLAVRDANALKPYEGVYFGSVATDIQWKKERNVSAMDEEILDDKIRELVSLRLRESGLFKEVMERGAPDAGSEGFLRMDCSLVVEPGSRAARYAVGMGAGKSKSVLEILFVDPQTGERKAFYHGYGVGTGMAFKLVGGGARKMTQDDIQENAKKLVELLAEAQ